MLYFSLFLSLTVQNGLCGLHLTGKWSAINAKVSDQVTVECRLDDQSVNTSQVPKWLLTDYQRKIAQTINTGTSSTLKINPPLSEKLQGEYVCALNNTKEDEAETAKFNLTLYDSKKDSELSVVVENPIESVHEGGDARWIFELETRSNFTIEPDFSAEEKTEHFCKETGSGKYRCMMYIKNATEKDSNPYDFVVYNDITKKKLALALLVLPELKYMILDVPDSFKSGQSANPLCMVDGAVVLDTATLLRKVGVVWQFFACKPTDNKTLGCDEGKELEIEKISKFAKEEDQGDLTYTLHGFAPSMNGTMKCTGIDSKGRKVSATKRIIFDGENLNSAQQNSSRIDVGAYNATV